MSNKIKKPNINNSKRTISNPELPIDTRLCINFKDFKKQSISMKNFNNCFSNESECFSLMDKSLEKLKHISNCNNFHSLLIDKNMHCHTIEDDVKDLVKNILKEYGFPTGKIDAIFEGKLYQVKIADSSPASRLIFYLVSGYILFPLFMDVNHQLYKNNDYNFDIDLNSKKYSL